MMLAHVLLFKPRPDMSVADRRAFAAAFEQAVREIPSIRRFRVGRRVTHGREYERAMTVDYEYAAILEFDDVAGLQAYLRHPAHDELGTRLFAAMESGLIYDFEMRDEAGFSEWLASEVGKV
jgi:hypothetical protein